jgi:hypothetical protein
MTDSRRFYFYQHFIIANIVIDTDFLVFEGSAWLAHNQCLCEHVEQGSQSLESLEKEGIA